MSHLQTPQIIAHRGASFDAPENTLASFALGWRQEADLAEIDIHLTADHQVAVLHDTTTDRVAGTAGTVLELSMAALSAFGVGVWEGETQRIPLLSQVINGVPAGKKLLIEIKCGAEVIPALKAALASSPLPAARALIHCFNFAVAAECKRELPLHSVHWLEKYSPNRGTGSELSDIRAAIARVKAVGLDGLSLHFDWPVTAGVVDAIHAAGLKLFVWTINDAAIGRRIAALGVDGIITDRPGWLRGQLQ